MRCLAVIGSLVLTPAIVAAQSVPARDLLDFPLATMAEPPALANGVAGGLRNPASGPQEGFRVSAAAFNTPTEQAVAAYLVGASFAIRPSLTGSVTAVRAAIGDILRTSDTPNTQDPDQPDVEIPYSTTLTSAGLAGTWRGATVGIALRYRVGQADATRVGATSVDVGARLDQPGGLPIELAASTFLLSARERSAFQLAGEATVVERTSLAARAGYSFTTSPGAGAEHFASGAVRYGRLEGRGGVVRSVGRIATTHRLRVGVGLHYARYLVAVAREEHGAGLGPAYQFALTSTYP